ncbi:hypothetical protein ABN763_07100 [Spongiivirga sp. MCCC 1A20706]|uniref:hypothetical protein n=1 Tax=Spongiivirga sp. MCCC 1A20706 TaxID=3160963 RepID=UPI00397739C6
MSRHSLFGPSKDEIWKQIANDIDGEFIDRGFWKTNELRYNHKEWELLLDTIHRDKITYTRLRVPFLNKDSFYFKIYREGFFADIGKFFGMQDIEIGDPRFDNNYIIQSNNNNKIRKFLRDPKLKILFEMIPKVSVSIRKDEGWFGKKYPDGVNVLYFEQAGILKNKETLKLLFQLFAEILDRLVAIDSAYESDPKMRL